jgi:hypothetical protein
MKLVKDGVTLQGTVLLNVPLVYVKLQGAVLLNVPLVYVYLKH